MAIGIKTSEHIKLYQKMINDSLEEYIPQAYPDMLFEAMRYSVLGSGKRLRGILCLEACRSLGGSEEIALPVACSIEIIHAQSLIHDDLPCMDDDDFRRGKPSTHKKFGEAQAVLAGDALIPFAYDVFLKYTSSKVPDKTKLQIIKEFSETIGANGLVGGQFIDVEKEGILIDPETLKYIHSNKTGALYKFSLRSGALLVGCNDDKLKVITEFSEAIGLAFQISDDILDITGSKEELGKTPGKDKASGKNTYPLIHGFDNSVSKLDDLRNYSLELLKNNKIESEIFVDITNYIADRIK